tara:strand:+ start:52 stop:369 length:318 start_codon:yes stop_codon:yes gene_type:complete
MVFDEDLKTKDGFKVLQCVICLKNIEHKMLFGKVFTMLGNDAEPIAEGRCCDFCDCVIVLPSRIGDLFDKPIDVITYGLKMYKERMVKDKTVNITTKSLKQRAIQ